MGSGDPWRSAFGERRGAAYLNLIEPWWKILRSLALAGRLFETRGQIEEAVTRAVGYWNASTATPTCGGGASGSGRPGGPGIGAMPTVPAAGG
ncbi:MAG: hypothetical protein AVDCRST_MAG02-3190 [uncultured Rubrobacteraceae bacterium]|uniref:Uncharacterized protein n=1 Tax=uncultured Rubrobacteraceae bacterium TaxID=349277 RepID=A0A6J4R9H3_9ACTN|nr:MAG: hypothetical protein AVDCRST_MAG02-3190 [uncultured Rubrobacteraceae bacterium]